jgi:hypothetical protein
MGEDEPLFCSRCSKILKAGRGEFYVVAIQAVADPTPPEFTEADLTRDARRDWNAIIAALGDLSAQEALDQVYRRVVIHLCNACFGEWIENPAEAQK